MGLLTMLTEKWFPPPGSTQSFEGRTVLVTGANTGLGLEAAKKVAALNPKRLIITARSHSKGDSTKQQIQQWLASAGLTNNTEIVPLVLNMGTADGVKSFVKQLALITDRVDAAILNAGINTPVCTISPDGYEQTIQVNTISTVFLATLLLPILISTSDSTGTQSHLTFVSSRVITRTKVPMSPEFQSSPTPVKDLAQAAAFPTGLMRGQIQYGHSKLFLEYAMRRLNQLPAISHKDGKPKVIINSVCPGACSTDIARTYDRFSLLYLGFLVIGPLVLKSAASGADAYLVALTAGQESRGRLWAVTHYEEEWDALKTPEGKALGEKVWRELQAMMIGWDSSVSTLLQGS